MAKPSQRDLARSGPRGGISGGVSSGGLGGSDRPDDRDRREGPEGGSDPRTRPRTAGIFGEGGDGAGGGEPTAPTRGLIEQAEDFLTRTHKEIQAALSGPAQDITPPTERPGRRPPNDDRPGGLLRPPPAPEEEEPPIIPGDPSNLGARGRRRRSENDSNASPVLRRGLLGV